MTTAAERDTLVQSLDRVVHEVLTYFEGPGRANPARIDRWGAREVLMHFIYFHQATAWGIQSAALGGPMWVVPAETDHVNEVCRRLHEHESVDDLLIQARLAHTQLRHAAGNAPDLDRPCFKRANGDVMTGRQRLEALARHWAEHVRELQAAAPG